MSTNDGAQFKFYLNRQGIQGKKGDKGDKGFSPTITPGQDTASTYTLQITNETGSFETTNLREHKEDRGGTYVRYDRTEQEMYLGDPNYANTEQYGEVKFCTEAEFTNASESTVVSPANVKDYVTEEVTAIDTTLSKMQENFDTLESWVTNINGTVQMNTTNITNLTSDVDTLETTVSGHTTSIGELDTKVSDLTTTVSDQGNDITAAKADITQLKTDMTSKLEASNIVAGENVSVSVDGNNVTISSTGGGGTGGTTDYTQLTNKPQINSVELTGNKTSADLGLATASEVEGLGTEVDNLAGTVTEVESGLANKQDTISVEAPLVKEGSSTLKLSVGDGLSVVEGKLTASGSDTYSKTEIDTKLDKKQDVLTAGENITITEGILGQLTPDWYTDSGKLDPVPELISMPSVGNSVEYFPFNQQTVVDGDALTVQWDMIETTPMTSATTVSIQINGSNGTFELLYDGYFNLGQRLGTILIKSTLSGVAVIDSGTQTINGANQNVACRYKFTYEKASRQYTFTKTIIHSEEVISTVSGSSSADTIIPLDGVVKIRLTNINGRTGGINVYTDSVTVAAGTQKITIISATGSSAPANMVTTDTEQTISGAKTFTSSLTVSNEIVTSSGFRIASGASGNTVNLGSNNANLAFYSNSVPTVDRGGESYTNVDSGNVSNYAVTFDNSTFTGGLKLWKGTQTEYDGITTKDDHTLYIIVAGSEEV